MTGVAEIVLFCIPFYASEAMPKWWHCFASSVPASVSPGFCLVPSVFLSFCENTKRISMKFVRGNHCRQQIKLLHFVGN